MEYVAFSSHLSRKIPPWRLHRRCSAFGCPWWAIATLSPCRWWSAQAWPWPDSINDPTGATRFLDEKCGLHSLMMFDGWHFPITHYNTIFRIVFVQWNYQFWWTWIEEMKEFDSRFFPVSWDLWSPKAFWEVDSMVSHMLNMYISRQFTWCTLWQANMALENPSFSWCLMIFPARNLHGEFRELPARHVW